MSSVPTNVLTYNFDYDYDDEKETATQTDQAASRCLKIFNSILFVIGGALCGASFWAAGSMLDGIGTIVLYAVGGVGILTSVIGILGIIGVKTRSPPVLLTYFMCLLMASFLLLFVGGFCLILTSTVESYLEDSWGDLVSSFPLEDRASLTLDSVRSEMKYAMYGVGAGALVLLLLIITAMSSVVRLVTPIRAYSSLLLASVICIMPVGAAVTGAGLWIVSSAESPSAVLSSFVAFAVGTFLLLLCCIACLATSLQSRGLFRLFTIPTGFVALLFVGCGIASTLFERDVARAVSSVWTDLRPLLPQSFAGKYDPDQFSSFMNKNTRALGLGLLLTGLLLLLQAIAAVRMRSEIRKSAEIDSFAQSALKANEISLEDYKELLQMRRPGCAARAWKSVWTNGSMPLRLLVGTVAFLFFGGIAAVLALAGAAFYLSSSCSSQSLSQELFAFPTAQYSLSTHVDHQYPRGNIRLTVNPASTSVYPSLAFSKAAVDPSAFPPGGPSLTPRRLPLEADTGLDVIPGVFESEIQVASLSVIPGPGKQFFLLDIGCQTGIIDVTLPSAESLGGQSIYASVNNVTSFQTLLDNGAPNAPAAPDFPLMLYLNARASQTSVSMDLRRTPERLRPRVHRMRVRTEESPVALSGLKTGSRGIDIRTGGGDVSLALIDAWCDSQLLGTSFFGVLVDSERGRIELDSVSVSDCDTFLNADSAPVIVRNSAFVASAGSSRVSVAAARGAVSVVASSMGQLIVTGNEGSVKVTNSSITDNLRISTSSGKISVEGTQFGHRATVQIDSEVGDVLISTGKFAGVLSVVTGGSITCSGNGFDEGPAACGQVSSTVDAEGVVLSVIEQLNINCASKGDCAYVGLISIVSPSANVKLHFDRWIR